MKFLRQKWDLNVILISYDIKVESNIHAPVHVLLNLVNLLQKRGKMLSEPHILSLFPN